jgi:hypothetical protein
MFWPSIVVWKGNCFHHTPEIYVQTSFCRWLSLLLVAFGKNSGAVSEGHPLSPKIVKPFIAARSACRELNFVGFEAINA